MDDGMDDKSAQAINGVARKPAVARSGAAPVDASDPIVIGLQQLFAAVAAEPVPDEFMALLDRIDANERARQGESATAPNSLDGGPGK